MPALNFDPNEKLILQTTGVAQKCVAKTPLGPTPYAFVGKNQLYSVSCHSMLSPLISSDRDFYIGKGLF